MGEEGEGDEAELLAVFDLLRTASVDGGERRRALPERGHGARVRVRVRGKMREGERADSRRPSYPPGERGGVDLVRRGRGRRARSLQPWRYRRRTMTLL